MSNQPLSPFDVAMNPPKLPNEWYGQMSVNAWFCALVKGTGKVAWDPNVTDPNTGQPMRRYTCIELKLTPMTDQADLNPVERNMLAEFGEWTDIVLPSLKDLGITSLQALNNAWVRAEMVPTGRTYTNSNGETRDATTFKFLSVYAGEEACRNAYIAARGSGPAYASSPSATNTMNTAPTNGNGNGNREREVAEEFLKPYVQNAWRKSGGDLDKARGELAQMIAGQALLAKYFTVDSPEVMDLLAAEVSA